ncbi:hypothetical protein ACV3W1_13500 [Clostridium perfringens]
MKKFTNINIVDNTYIQILIGGGIILTIIIFLWYFNAIKMLISENKIIELSFVVSLLFYFNVESIGLRPENVISLFWWYLIIKYGVMRKKLKNINFKSGEV